jgi:carboxyvinyl-carboxyphosphonate phosphorylmutase
MADWTPRRERLRAVLAGNRCVHPGSVSDPLSARIAEQIGFECGIFAGSVASLVVLGAPDLIVLTLTEFAEQAHRICRAGELPLLVDADHGYGNALNVMRTVQELESAGVAALSIEDTVLPRAFGAGAGPTLISIEEGVGKMRAAIAARSDKSLIIAGRTSAPGLTGVADTIARAKAYEGAGVDAIFLVGVKHAAQLEAIAAEVTLPLILGGAGPDLSDADLLAARGVRIALQGHRPIMAAVAAVYDTLAGMRAGKAAAELPKAASPQLMQQLTRDADYARWTETFLRS